MLRLILACTAMVFLLAACRSSGSETDAADAETAPATFAEDVAFLNEHADVHVLEAPSGARVALSAPYQGRVMTSSIAPDGPSFGWVNRSFIESGQQGTSFDNYGGEDRFWFGPEGGQYALFFEEGDPFELENWFVPEALNVGTWTITDSTDESLTFTRRMELTNYQGTSFEADVERTVRLLSQEDMSRQTDITLSDSVDWVGFESINRVTNAGSRAWTKEDGLLSIWILGQFESFEGATTVVIPYDEGAEGRIVNDAYFGKVPEDRLVVDEGHILYKADGRYRSKIGVAPGRATPIFGSYNEALPMLTLIQYVQPEEAPAGYVNSMWEQQEQPFEGDVINSYNDPPRPSGATSFYELETSSPALALRPGESFTHTHRTVHLVGSPGALDDVMQETLGISVEDVAAIF